MAHPSPDSLDHVSHDLGAIEHALRHFHLNPVRELETILTIADDIRALRPRVQAIGAAFSTDTAAAVAAQKAADDEANAGNVAALADAQAALTDLTGDVAAAETAGGVQSPAPAPAAPVEQTEG